jgi:cellulose synthase/poly-beta-1,6-N-acetylglucosamine synthase-like glycosyltransferase
MSLPFCILMILLALVLVQSGMAAGFVNVLRQAGRSRWPKYQPKSAVILCLRGGDPFLSACLNGVLNQDYPDYDVRIVVDSTSDPSWRVAEAAIARSPSSRVQLLPLSRRRSTCSLKCSGVLQAIETLDDSHEVLAIVDADAVPHPTWLRELVAPLADPRVGAATGNRWYMPRDASWGALVRYFWHMAAIVMMYYCRIAWGGTLAIKTRLLRESDVLERWGNAFCEDTMMFDVLRRKGLRLAFVPSLIMVNRENCDLNGVFHWVTRQLLTARLYHSGWIVTVVHGIGTSAALLAACGLLLYGVLQGDGATVAYSAIGLAMYLVGMLTLAAVLEAAVRRVVRQRREPTAWLSISTLLHCWAAVPLTQIYYCGALFTAIFLRRVTWRGVTYHIRGPRAIILLDDRPYEVAPQPAADLASL